MKVIKSVLKWLQFFMTGKGEVADEAIREGLIDYSGQGRNEFGR